MSAQDSDLLYFLDVSRMTIVLDETSGHQAIYLDGVFHSQYDVCLATDVAWAAGDKPVTIDTEICCLAGRDWPKTLGELLKSVKESV